MDLVMFVVVVIALVVVFLGWIVWWVVQRDEDRHRRD
jgi:hypothetical protein